ncbi:acyltransferase [Pseudoalteromonas spongiae]|uniref:Acyltransferase n=1 Tax=Pseudoalteromonas spongiae TaxID=298657 RepID=A0ABU8ETC6_9GAMM
MNKIEGFDGLRAIAAISVVLTHLHVFKTYQDNGWIHESLISTINGDSGVQAFFVLSGFLITNLLLIEVANNGKVSLYNFYVRRSLRIFPLYFLVVFLLFIFHITGEGVTNYKSLAFAGTYSYNFIPKVWYSGVLGHTWSLAVEEHFYLIWPFLFISFSLKLRKLSIVTFLFILLSFFAAIILTNIDWLNANFFIKRWTFIAGANIAMGALLAMVLKDEFLGEKLSTFLQSKISIFVILIIVFNQVFTSDLNYFISQYLRGIGFTLLIGWIYLNQSSKLTQLLETQPLSYLGKVSYGIYMYQGFFLSTGPYRAHNQTWPPEQYLGIILLIITVPLSYHYFEKPIMKLKYKYQRPTAKEPNRPMQQTADTAAD